MGSIWSCLVDKPNCATLGSTKFEHWKQGRIHGNPVADGWAGAVIKKPLAILEIFRTDQRTNGPTDTARCRVAGQ